MTNIPKGKKDLTAALNVQDFIEGSPENNLKREEEKPNNTRKVSQREGVAFSVRLRYEIHKKAKEVASQNGQSLSSYIRFLVHKALREFEQ